MSVCSMIFCASLLMYIVYFVSVISLIPETYSFHMYWKLFQTFPFINNNHNNKGGNSESTLSKKKERHDERSYKRGEIYIGEKREIKR